MDEKDLRMKYLVLKIEDINNKLSILEKEHFWKLVSYVIFKKENGYKPTKREEAEK